MASKTQASPAADQPGQATEEQAKYTAPNEATALATQKDLEVDMESLFEASEGKGTENITLADKAIPFLGVLQDLSPQVRRTEPGYIEGAAVGMLFDSVTKEVFPGDGEGLLVIPIGFQKSYNVWRKRKSGGGFKGSFPTPEAAADRIIELGRLEKVEDRIPNEQLDVTDTAMHYVMYQHPKTGQWRTALLSLKSTMLNASRSWLAVIDGIEFTRKAPKPGQSSTYTPPSYAMVYRLTTTIKRKDQNAWFVPQFEPVSRTPSVELFMKAESLNKQLSAGLVKVDFAAEEDISAGVPAQGAPDAINRY